MSDPCQYVISALETHNSRLDKEAIIEVQMTQKNDEFFEGCRLALDPMITFGLKQIPEKTNEDGTGLPWDGFISVVKRLANRELTGNVARSAVEALMNTATKAEWNGWYRRILIKDLRCGVSEKTVNKVVEKKNPNYAVPVFSCQLAHDSANHEGKVGGEKLIEVKLDGVRVITIVYPNGRVDQFSRNGKELVNFETIKEQMSKTAGHYNVPMVFDGEVMSSSFQDLMKQVHRKSDVKADDAILHLFDILTLEDFEAGVAHVPQLLRSETLIGWHNTNKALLPNVEVVAHEVVNISEPEGAERFKAINQMAIEGGYEGIMIKEINAPYECKRTVNWLKLKPFIEVSLNVVAVEEGTGKNVGRLGALVCEGEDDGKRIRVNVGSGFSDDSRNDYWISRDKVVGKIVEVRADAITQNQDGSYSLRFPRFLHFRGFANGEKI
jgi:DNA ligase-1